MRETGSSGGRSQRTPILRRIPGPMWLIASGSALNSMGLSFLWSLTTLYVHVHLGASLAAVGAILTAQQGAGLLGSLLGGTLSDRLGGRGPLLAAAALGALSMIGIAVDGALLVYTVGAVLAGLSVGVTFACLNALAPRAWPDGGRDAFNVVYVSFNLGVAAGPVLAGILAAVAFRLTFWGGALGLSLFFLIVALGFRGETFSRVLPLSSDPKARTPLSDLRLLGWPVWILVLGLFLDWVVYAQWFTLVPDFLHRAGVPIPLYSLLWSVNGLLIIAGQPLMQQLVRRVPAVRNQMLLGSGAFLLGMGMLTFWRGYLFYVAAMVCSTVGEMLVWPAVPAAADQNTAPERRGLVQGLVSMAAFGGRTVGPLAGVSLAAFVAAGPVFAILALVIFAGGLLYAAYRRPGPQATEDGAALAN